MGRVGSSVFGVLFAVACGQTETSNDGSSGSDGMAANTSSGKGAGGNTSAGDSTAQSATTSDATGGRVGSTGGSGRDGVTSTAAGGGMSAAGGSAAAGGSTAAGGNTAAGGASSPGTYLVPLPGFNFIAPPGAGADFAEFLRGVLLRLEPGDSGGTLVTLGRTHEDVQDTCSKTMTVAAEVVPRGISVGPVNHEVYLRSNANAPEEIGVVAVIEDFTLTDLQSDGDTLGAVAAFRGTLDMREVYRLFYELLDPSADSVCARFESAGSACEACSDGERYCLDFEAVALGAEPWTGGFREIAESCAESDLD